MYGGGYSKVMDYGAIDAFQNPGYGTSAGMQDVNDDLMVQKMADVLQNQFGLKRKIQGQDYTPPFPRVVPQGGFATKVETSYRFHKVFWAG
jgi:hypothetical protein